MNKVSQRLGAFVATAAALPSLLTANPGAALADGGCKQAPPPPSSRAYITNVSKPVLIADVGPSVAQTPQPNCPPPDAVTLIQRQNQRVIDGQRDLRETLRDLPPIPGS